MTHADEPGIVGRAARCDASAMRCRHRRERRRSAVLVSGEAGMGKTSLIRAAIDACAADGRPRRLGNLLAR